MRLYEMGNEMNRRPFLDRLFAFLEEKGSPITSMPVISKQPLDLFKLYVCVQEKGGMVEVSIEAFHSKQFLFLMPVLTHYQTTKF